MKEANLIGIVAATKHDNVNIIHAAPLTCSGPVSVAVVNRAMKDALAETEVNLKFTVETSKFPCDGIFRAVFNAHGLIIWNLIAEGKEYLHPNATPFYVGTTKCPGIAWIGMYRGENVVKFNSQEQFTAVMGFIEEWQDFFEQYHEVRAKIEPSRNVLLDENVEKDVEKEIGKVGLESMDEMIERLNKKDE